MNTDADTIAALEARIESLEHTLERERRKAFKIHSMHCKARNELEVRIFELGRTNEFLRQIIKDNAK